MDGQTIFSNEQIPYGKLAKLGISEEKLPSMPENLRNTLMDGKVSPFIQAQIQTENGKVISLPLKLQMVRDQTGAILLMTYPIRRTIASDMKGRTLSPTASSWPLCTETGVLRSWAISSAHCLRSFSSPFKVSCNVRAAFAITSN